MALSPSQNVTTFSQTKCPIIPTGASAVFNPNDPTKSGYELVFDSEFNDFSDFDLTCSAPPANTGCANPQGKNWYLDAWTFPVNANTTNPATDLAISNGVLSIHNTIHTGNWSISTMAPSNGASHGPAAWQKNWNGTVFTGGWYAEARISSEYRDINNAVVPAQSEHGHSAFWAYATDHFNTTNPGGLWPGQGPSYVHFVEDDMLDGVQGTSFYITSLIDWYDSTSAKLVGTGMNAFNQVDAHGSFGFSQPVWLDRTFFHIFGQLWVPATATTQGFLQNYLDGVPTSKFSWTLYDSSATPPPTGAAIGNIIDQDHMSIILGADPPTGGENRDTEYVDWVHVWQLPAAATVSGNVAIMPKKGFTGGNGSCV